MGLFKIVLNAIIGFKFIRIQFVNSEKLLALELLLDFWSIHIFEGNILLLLKVFFFSTESKVSEMGEV